MDRPDPASNPRLSSPLRRLARLPAVIIFALLAASSGCASSPTAVQEQRAGDRQMKRGSRASDGGDHAAAAEAFGLAHGHFARADRLASSAHSSRAEKQAAAWQEAGEAARLAAPHAALGAASAHYQVALQRWGEGDRLFDALDFPAALAAYEQTEISYAEEERWLRIARRRLATQPPESETAGGEAARSVEEDLAKNHEERQLLAGNMGRSRLNEQARSASYSGGHRGGYRGGYWGGYWGGFWGGCADAGWILLDLTARFAIVTLHILAEPIIWECLFGIVRVVCVLR